MLPHQHLALKKYRETTRYLEWADIKDSNWKHHNMLYTNVVCSHLSEMSHSTFNFVRGELSRLTGGGNNQAGGINK